MKAMIFAAGLGTRLGSITSEIPKALVDINGKSILRIAVEKVSSHGFTDIIVNIHHFADMVEKEIIRLREAGYRITVSDERELLLETGGGLFKAKWFFDDSPFLVYNADIISDIDLKKLYDFHIQNNAFVTLAARRRKGNRFLLVDENGILRGWRNKSTGEEIMAGDFRGELTEAGFSGIHIVNPGIFRHMTEGIYSLTPLYLKLAAEKKILICRHDNDKWFDIGTRKELEKARKNLASG
jgi:NDP-sugar pyrophosphorylase family protein